MLSGLLWLLAGLWCIFIGIRIFRVERNPARTDRRLRQTLGGMSYWERALMIWVVIVGGVILCLVGGITLIG
jgi:hypothetical protein